MSVSKLVALTLCCFLLVACKSKEEQARDFFLRGTELLQSGDEDRARIEFLNAVRLVPTYIDAQLAFARLLLKGREYGPAYRTYTRVAEQDPSNIEALVAMSRIAFMGRNWADFDRNATAAIAAAPDDPQARVLDLARNYRQAVLDKDSSASSAILVRIAALQKEVPDDEILRRILIDGYLADGKLDQALSEVEKSIATTPDEPGFYQTKIQILASLQDKPALEAALYQMTAAFPDDAEPQTNLLRFLVSDGKTDAAEAFLRSKVAAAPKDDTTAFVTLVQFLLQVRDSATAIAELDGAIAADPTAIRLRALHASLIFDSGKRDEGIAEMQQIVGPDSADVPTDQMKTIKVTLATMLNATGNEVGARRLVEEILAEEPDAVAALKMQARWLIADDETDKAINAMRTALAQSPQDAEAMQIMADAYQRAGDSVLMMSFLSQANEASGNAPAQALRYAAALSADDNRPQAESTLIAALRLQPHNVDILSALGTIYLAQKDTPRARQVADTLKAIEEPAAQNSANGITLQLLAQDAGSEQALSYLETLANGTADGTANGTGGSDAAKFALIRAKLESQDPKGALEYVDQLVAENPDSIPYAYFRALTLAATGGLDAAETAFTDLVERAPQTVAAWTMLARLKSRTDDPTLVIAVLDKGLSANPDVPDLLWAKATYLQEQGDIDGAIALYETLYEQNSSALIVANNLASLLATYRADDASLQRAKVIARRMQGTDVPALQDTYGWILFRGGDAAGALPYLEPAAKALTEDASVQYHLGMAYQALSRPEDAMNQFRLAMSKVGPMGTGALSSEIQDQIDGAGAPVKN